MPFIYKITNKQNQKIYVGQTYETIEKRFRRHITDANSYRTDTVFARAIRKYGEDSFVYEELEETTKENLNEREIFWIDNLKSTVEYGNYNTSDGGSNSNTYKYKSENEMEIIKEKISKSKIGGKNPMATKVDAKDFETNKEYSFNSISECMEFFKLPNKEVVIHRCNGKTTSLYKKKYSFKYSSEKEYNVKSKTGSYPRSIKFEVQEENSNNKYIFESMLEFGRFFDFGRVKFKTEKIKKGIPFKYTHRETKRKFIINIL